VEKFVLSAGEDQFHSGEKEKRGEGPVFFFIPLLGARGTLYHDSLQPAELTVENV
jgi:trehalose utilization protein